MGVIGAPLFRHWEALHADHRAVRIFGFFVNEDEIDRAKNVALQNQGRVVEQLARIASVPKREFSRRGINQHTLEKICAKVPVRATKLALCPKVLEERADLPDTPPPDFERN